MSPDATYNGYANYQTWNVCLWISNDDGLYGLAKGSRSYKDFCNALKDCNSYSVDRFGEKSTTYLPIAFETPDGVAWHDSNVNLAEMQGYWKDFFSCDSLTKADK